MAGRVLLTGASGFVGKAVLHELVARGYGVNALVHRRPADARDPRVRIVQGDLFDPAELDRAAEECSAVIHLVGIIREKRRAGITFERIHHQGTRNIVDAAKRKGIRRFIHMSALGTRANAISEYHRTKFLAEEYVRASTLDWTIFRPSLIHGPGGELMQLEAMWARKKAPPPLFFMPFMPYFGGKRAGKIQPVFVDDVARAFVDALEKPATIGQVYELGGPDAMTWPEFHNIVAQAIVGHRRMTASMPAPIAKFLASIGLGPLLGFNRDQVQMSLEENTADLEKFIADFGWAPRRLDETLRGYANEL